MSTSKLQETACTTNLHLFLREPALLELACRGDSNILGLCEKMLASSDPDEHFIAIQVLAAFGTKQSIERLLSYCVNCTPSYKKTAIHALATTLTPEYIDYFNKLVTHLACTGVLDITAWTLPAIKALERICQRKSIRIVWIFHGKTASSSTRILNTHAAIRSKTKFQEQKLSESGKSIL